MENGGAPTFNIYVMSYQRSDMIIAQDLFEYCTYVVRENEVELYRKAGVKNILAIPSGSIQFGFIDTLWWVIHNTPEDVIFISDDDIKRFVYRMDDWLPIDSNNFVDPVSTTTAEIERIAQVLYDLNLGLAYDGPQKTLFAYDKEWNFKGMPGHCRWVNKKALKAIYDSKDDAASDIDMAMQEILYNRITLQPKYFLSDAGQMETNSGGVTMTRQETIDYRLAMENKWGKYYEYDIRKNQAKINVKR